MLLLMSRGWNTKMIPFVRRAWAEAWRIHADFDVQRLEHKNDFRLRDYRLKPGEITVGRGFK